MGDEVIIHSLMLKLPTKITAIEKSILHLGYLTINVAASPTQINLPVNRDLVLYGNMPVLS